MFKLLRFWPIGHTERNKSRNKPSDLLQKWVENIDADALKQSLTLGVNGPLGHTEKFSPKARNGIQLHKVYIFLEYTIHIRFVNRVVPILRFISKPQHLPFFPTVKGHTQEKGLIAEILIAFSPLTFTIHNIKSEENWRDGCCGFKKKL